VLRGGSWNNNPVNVRASNRNNDNPSNRNNNNGFRLSKTMNRPGPLCLRMRRQRPLLSRQCAGTAPAVE
jgi:hypothetical protein